mgnify:CR=1 FL=1
MTDENIELVLQGVLINTRYPGKNNMKTLEAMLNHINAMKALLETDINSALKSHIKVNMVLLLIESYGKLNQEQRNTLKVITQNLSDQEIINLFYGINNKDYHDQTIHFSIIEYMTPEALEKFMKYFIENPADHPHDFLMRFLRSNVDSQKSAIISHYLNLINQQS